MKELWFDESGQGLVEYGLILLFIAIALITTLQSLGTETKALYPDLPNELSP